MKQSISSRKRGCKRRFYGCLLLLIFLTLLLCGGLFFFLHEVTAAAESPPPRDVFLLIDNSHSMFEKGGEGSAPDFLRIDAARLFISYLGIDDGRTVHRCGVIAFGTEAQSVVALTPLDSPARRAAVFEQIRQPERMGWTDHVAALALAQRQIEQSDGGNRPALVMLTDGKPEWEQTPPAEEVTAYREQLGRQAAWLAERDIPLYIILLANDDAAADPEIAAVWTPLWQEMAATTPGGAFFQARRAGDLLGIYHDIVVKLAGNDTEGAIISTAVPPQGLNQTVPVEAGLARVTFVVSKSHPDLRLTILRPGGAPLTAADPNVRYAGGAREELWTVDAPAAGAWQVQASGEGRLIVWKDFRLAPATPTATTTTTASATPSPPTATPPPAATPLPSPTRRLTAAVATPAPLPFSPTAQPKTRRQEANSRRNRMQWGVLIFTLGTLLVAGRQWYLARRPKVSGSIRILAGPGTENGYGVIDLDDRQQRRITLGGPEADVTFLGATAQVTIRPAAESVDDIYPMMISGQDGAQLNEQPLSPDRPRSLNDADIITLDQHRLRYENLRLRRAGDR